MRATVITLRTDASNFVIQLRIDGRLEKTHTATLGSVVSKLNRLIDRWSSHQDVTELTATEIPWPLEYYSQRRIA